jgi:hypothetical protein
LKELAPNPQKTISELKRELVIAKELVAELREELKVCHELIAE